MKRVLIVSPAYNEADLLPEFVAAAAALRARLAGEGVELRLLVVDDGSADRTLEILRESARTHSAWLSYLSFTANFGYQAALVAGMTRCGDWPEAIVTMDCDLEHPLDKVPEFIRLWRDERAIVVSSIRAEDARLSRRKRAFSKLFYRLTARLTGLEIVPGQADFRLWDARIVRSVREYLPHVGSLRVFAAWLPGKKRVVSYSQNLRENRSSRFTFGKSLDLALISIIRFSDVPLRAIGVLGGIGILFSVVYGSLALYRATQGQNVPGWTSTVFTVIFMSCLQLLSLGIMAGYFRRLVFSKDLPPFVVEEASPVPSEPK